MDRSLDGRRTAVHFVGIAPKRMMRGERAAIEHMNAQRALPRHIKMLCAREWNSVFVRAANVLPFFSGIRMKNKVHRRLRSWFFLFFVLLINGMRRMLKENRFVSLAHAFLANNCSRESGWRWNDQWTQIHTNVALVFPIQTCSG